MKLHPVLDVSELPPYTHGSRGALWWGFAGMIAIEATVFTAFIASYLYLKMSATAWPPMPEKPPELLLPTINTVILIGSSIALFWAEKGIEKGDQRRLSIGLLVSLLLGTIFLVLKVIEYSKVPYRWDSHAYGSIIWTIIGFHSAHVASVVLKTIVVDVLAWRGYFNRERRLGVTVNGLYWHFVVGIWIPLYITIYWVPRL